jgi:hypothetical protein
MVIKVGVPSPHQRSNPRFDVIFVALDGILFHGDVTLDMKESLVILAI